jgi:V8-like Glu-specific endopeptidase
VDRHTAKRGIEKTRSLGRIRALFEGRSMGILAGFRHRANVVIGASSLVLSCASVYEEPATEQARGALIHGSDDRKDVYAVDDEALKALALNSTLAALAPQSLVERADGRFRVTAAPLGQVANLCSSEPFSSQPAAASCSGVLVAEQLLLTAGHCVSPENQCDDRVWAFDYALTSAGVMPLLEAEDVYRCRSIPQRTTIRDAAGRRWDHAFVELDRPVAPPRKPVRIRDAALQSGDALSVIGYPDGLPVKIDTGAFVVDGRATLLDYFGATSDTFTGSSGSGVFDALGNLAGTIARGGFDYELREDSGCFVSRRIPRANDIEQVEHASYVTTAIDCLCASGWPNEELCSSERAACRVGETSEPPTNGCALSPLRRDSGRDAGSVAAIAVLLVCTFRRVTHAA